MSRTRTTAMPTVLGSAVLVLAVAVSGCASVSKATPEEKTFSYAGPTLDVRAHEVATDLVAADRQDIKVTRWFDAKNIGKKEVSWTLDGNTLDLRAGCTGFANCDARFRVEVPRGLTVLRDGRPTDLKGGGV
ncbi:hypothetical protein ACWGB8_12435 [Kitasatospora sp. NPDC054939]